MDTLDPLLFNSIAKSREVIVYGSSSIRHSEGTVPDSISKMVAILVDLLASLEIPKADFIGFSMGGGIVQYMGYTYPQLVNKLILAGTQSGIGPGVALPPREVQESAGATSDQPQTKEDMMKLFFYPSETSHTLSHACTFDRLTDIKAPVLVTNSHTDIMSPTSNSFVLQQEISNTQPHLYPDGGHRHLVQVPELYGKHLELFLSS